MKNKKILKNYLEEIKQVLSWKPQKKSFTEPSRSLRTTPKWLVSTIRKWFNSSKWTLKILHKWQTLIFFSIIHRYYHPRTHKYKMGSSCTVECARVNCTLRVRTRASIERIWISKVRFKRFELDYREKRYLWLIHSLVEIYALM